MSLKDLMDVAQSQGRNGDTKLVHMTPGEVNSLQTLAQAHGGSLTINPATGLPEANFLSNILPAVAGAGLAMTGIGAPMAALMVGGGMGLMSGSLEKGLMAGLGAFGGAGLAGGLAGAGAAGAANAAGASQLASVAPTSSMVPGLAGLGEAGGATLGSGLGGTMASSAAQQAIAPAAGLAGLGEAGGAAMNAGLAQAMPNALTTNMPIAQAAPTFMGNVNNAGAGLQQLMSNPGGALEAMGGWQGVGKNALAAAAPMMGGLGAMGGAGGQEQRPVGGEGMIRPYTFTREAVQNRQPGERYFNTSFTPGTPSPARGYAAGGIAGYAEGGHPRQIKGPGDGLSDSVPAMIDGARPAALATDEFVVPADVVSQLGNGSSDAGARTLHAMMDRIRAQAHGTTRQQRPVQAEKVLPA